MATASGEYPTGIPRPARPVAAVIGVTVSESTPTTNTFVLAGVTASAFGAWPAGMAGMAGPGRSVAVLIGVTVFEP
jgi:hypothetical protein